MGLILDTSVLIEAERKGRTIGEVLGRLSGRGLLAISAITLMELSHGIARAREEKVRAGRERFLHAVQASFAVVPLDAELAVRAGLLNGELSGLGFAIGLADAIIGTTALIRNDGVATLNGRHFKVVPGLDVVEL